MTDSKKPLTGTLDVGRASTILTSVQHDAEDKTQPSRAAVDPTALRLPARYEDLGAVARGGFGEVRRVRDTRLDRVLAMKLLHPWVSTRPSLRQRFFTEIQLTAQLQHPGIVPVHDFGELADGRLWYVMKEVRGTTLADIFDVIHSTSDRHRPDTGSGTATWTFRRVVDAFARIAQTVAYAHARGVVHRDLKPSNLMVGEFGEVLVMDWGLARRIRVDVEDGLETGETDGRETTEEHCAGDAGPAVLTRQGDILGTPAYMPPEQARGATRLHGPASDVYALGAVLYDLLGGRPPYLGTGRQVVGQILAGPPPPVERMATTNRVLPRELVRVCEEAMRRDIDDRCTAEALAADVVAWLDGARRRERALAVVQQAQTLEPEIATLRANAAARRAEAQKRLDGLRPFDPVEKKQPGWALEDEAAQLEVDAALQEAQWLQTVQGALTVDPELSEAHAALAAFHAEALLAAERGHRDLDAVRAEAALRVHDRGQFVALLRGEGAVTLVTDPPGAEVQLERYVLSGRRLVPRVQGVLGVTPLLHVPLQKGSYRLRINAPGHHEVMYPVLIERGQHWDGVPPGGTEPFPIALPAVGELGPDDCYVPAGWCWIGGDPEAPDSLPATRIWVDGFAIGRYPVTIGEYLAFLNDLVASGRESDALTACPRRELGAARSGEVLPVFPRVEGREFQLPPDQDQDLPVVLVDWHAARGYAAWFGERTGLPWRLPNELEREKAARGVDGRFFPWGNHTDATFFCGLESHVDEPRRMSVHAYPTDASPHGVRGLAGNVRDWCLNLWKLEGPAMCDGRLQLDAADARDPDFRSIRGGSWGSSLVNGRAAGRFGSRPDRWTMAVGVRVTRSLGCRPPD